MSEAKVREEFGFFSWFRLFTPLAVTVVIFLTGLLINKVDKLDDKVFKHLTNADLHTPRSIVVESAEFEQHCKLAEFQVDAFKSALLEFKRDLKDQIRDMKNDKSPL